MLNKKNTGGIEEVTTFYILFLIQNSIYYKTQYPMCYALQTSYGGTEAVIDDNCGISKFYEIADTLSAHVQVQFLNQIDDTDTLDWDFRYKDHFLTLHYNMFKGVRIYPRQQQSLGKEKKAVMEVANFLERLAF